MSVENVKSASTDAHTFRGRSGFGEHKREHTHCKQSGGRGFGSMADSQRSQCTECGGNGMCQHRRGVPIIPWSKASVSTGRDVDSGGVAEELRSEWPGRLVSCIIISQSLGCFLVVVGSSLMSLAMISC